MTNLKYGGIWQCEMKKVFSIYFLIVGFICGMAVFLEGFQNGENVEVEIFDNKILDNLPQTQYALIIGIDKYEKYPNLNNPSNDAKVLKKILIERYYFQDDHITLLGDSGDKKATYYNIMKGLEKYINKLTDNDSLIITFNGHGYINKEFETIYWVPSDAEENNNKGEMKIGENIILGFLRKCKARHILIISASCYSGKLFYGILRSGSDLYLNKKSRQMIAAGKGTVSDGAFYERNSPFIKNVLTYLKNNTNPYVLATDIISELRNDDKCNPDQKPIGGAVEGTGDERGSYVFFYRYNEVERELLFEYKNLLTSFNQKKWNRNEQMRRGKEFIKKCQGFQETNAIRKFREDIEKKIAKINQEMAEINIVKEEYLRLKENLDKLKEIGDKIIKCQEFLEKSKHFSDEGEVKNSYYEVESIKQTLEGYMNLKKIIENRKWGVLKKKNACREFLKKSKEKPDLPQINKIITKAKNDFNELKTPRLYFGSSFALSMKYYDLLSFEAGYVLGEKVWIIPFISYDKNVYSSRIKDEVILSSGETIKVEARHRGTLNFGIRLGIRNSSGKKSSANIFFSYGKFPFSFLKVSNSDSITYGFKRISNKKAFDLFSMGVELNFHLTSWFAFTYNFIGTFPGKGSIDYEIYMQPENNGLVSYFFTLNDIRMSMGIKIYFLKR